MSENFEDLYGGYFPEDGIQFTMSENADGTLNISKEIVNSRLPGGMGEDHISLNIQ